MATALPSTGASGPAVNYSCDTSDLHMIHTVLRTQFEEAEKLVAGVAAGDAARANVVSDHVLELSVMLHGHHHGEDEILWDKLEQRAPACSVHVEKMKVEHKRVSDDLDAIGALLPAWRDGASVTSRDAVHTALAALNKAFESHIGQEEAEIAPVAAVTLSQVEWDQLAAHGRASTPRNRQFVQLGYMLASLPPEARGMLLKNIPAPVRLLYRLIGKRQYEQDRAKVYGSAA